MKRILIIGKTLQDSLEYSRTLDVPDREYACASVNNVLRVIRGMKIEGAIFTPNAPTPISRDIWEAVNHAILKTQKGTSN